MAGVPWLSVGVPWLSAGVPWLSNDYYVPQIIAACRITNKNLHIKVLRIVTTPHRYTPGGGAHRSVRQEAAARAVEQAAGGGGAGEP
eukprot:307579-Pyramimonas_sp.AAC.1